ncbi:MAG: IS1182 family transposase [Acidobacteria bacterium]|nr:IS1182 family transposase [Acidobacteriota bacterium]
MSRIYLSYDPEQRLLMPPDVRDWLPEGHLALFISDVVDELDLTKIKQAYESGDGRGRPPYHPLMMVKLLVYGYCIGRVSSRKIEKATHEDVGFRVLACNQHPDHDSIAEFRKRHLQELASLFVQVLKLCEQAGLVKLGHVAIDGSKLRANASKHKAMSYERMCEKEEQLAAEVARLLQEAAAVDEAEDQQYGKGRRGDELPAELARRESRLHKIREAKAALEEEAKVKAVAAAAAAEVKLEARKKREEETGKKTPGRKPQVVDVAAAKPEAKAQRNFTDPESRIMKDSATGSFEQSYNAQIAVDSEAQIIVAASLTQAVNDKQQLVPVLEAVKTNVGRMPEKTTADSGYFSAAAVTNEALSGVDLYVTPDRGKKIEQPSELVTESPSDSELEQAVIEQMREKLKTNDGREVYKQRKLIVEPVFGQVKEVRGFRRFSFRGLAKNEAEWDLICLTHNLLKLFRSGFCLQPACS